MMSQATLSKELRAIEPKATEPEAILALANAYTNFARHAFALTPITEAGATLGKNAMIAGLVGLNAPGQGSTAFQNGILAFWLGVAGGLTVSFTGAIAIVPPAGNSSLNSLLQPVFAANTKSQATQKEATDRIAAVMYTAAITGGFVTTPGPPPGIITPIL